MPRAFTPPEIALLVASRRLLLDEGWTERSIDTARRSGRLVPVRRGHYVLDTDWARLWPEARHCAHVIAVARDSRDRAVFSHESAAVLWGLPLLRHSPRRVQMTTVAPTRISSGPDVARHVAPLSWTDVTLRHGIRCTTLERTVFDLARTLRTEASVACADAAERQRAFRNREWDQDAAAQWRRGLHARLDSASGARGIRRARWVIDFADGRSESPGEGESRVQLVRLGFAMPRLQVPVPSPSGGAYLVDFGLDDAKAFGEFDGESKYLDLAQRSGRSMEQVMLDEKYREDWIRGTTQRRFARWGSVQSATPALLGARLRAFGITPPG